MNLQLRVAFVYIGILENSSRILKQIRLLQKNNIAVDIYVGNENDIVQDFDKLSINVFSNNIKHGGIFKYKSFVNPIRFCFKTTKSINKEVYNYIVCQELTTLTAGYLAKLLNKSIILIFDNNELSVERYNGLKKAIWSKIQKITLPTCDYIVHADPYRKEYFIEKYNLDPDKQVLVCNYPHYKKKIVKERKGDKINIIYLGVIHPNRNIEEIIEAFTKVDLDASFDIIGPGEQKYINKLKEKIKKNNNINILPSVAQNIIDNILGKYDIRFAFYSNTNLNNYYCAPNKIFQYINNKVAIVTNNYPGLKKIVENNNIGVCIEEINAEKLHSSITKIINEKLYNNITDELRVSYSWETQEDNFLSLFKMRPV